MDVKEIKDALSEVGKTIEANVEQKIKAQADNDAKAVKELSEKLAEMESKRAEMQKHLDGLEAKQKDINISNQKSKTFDEQVYDSLNANADKFKALKDDKYGKIDPFTVKAFDVKAAGTITRANYSGGTVGLTTWDPEFARLVRRQPYLRQLVSVRPITSQYVAWAEQANRDGGAGQTAEGTAKTQSDFDIVEASMKAEKITSYMKVSKEALADIGFLQSEINNELIELVQLKLDADILSGSGTTPAMKGILQYAPTFSVAGSALATAGGGVDQANEFDVIRAAVWQIENTGLGNFQAQYVVVNPVTAAVMDMRKLTDGQYVIPPFVSASGQLVAGLQVITNTGITAGNFLVGDFRKSNLAIREEINISVGYDADDFTKNLVTILAEVRAAHYIKTNHVGAFVQGTFSTAKAAMETA